MTEFRKIPSLKDMYEISEDGLILRNVQTKYQRKFYKNDSGYCCVNIQFGDFKKTLYVAALVAECWLGVKPPGYQIDHIDRDKNNNHFRNLRYVTKSHNIRNRTVAKRIFVTLTNQNDSWNFGTMAAAAKFISAKKQKSARCCKRKLTGRQKNIFGYSVTYEAQGVQQHHISTTPFQLSLFDL